MKQNSLWYLHLELDHCSNKPVFFSEKTHIPSGNSDDVQQAQNSHKIQVSLINECAQPNKFVNSIQDGHFGICSWMRVGQKASPL